MIVVALTGLARAGKDSVADILVRDHGFSKMSFAAPLKRMMRNLNPIVGVEFADCGDPDCFVICGNDYGPVYLQDLYDRGMTEDEMKASKYGDEVRRIWQRFGTDVMRAEQDDYWIQKAKDDMFESGYDRVVFTDCRFPNEADMIYGLNGTGMFPTYDAINYINSSVWQVVRPGVVLQPGSHVSEQHVGLMAEEVTIHNDGTLEDLAVTVTDAVRYVTGRGTPAGWVHAGYLTDGGVKFEGEH